MYKIILHKNAAKFFQNADSKLKDRLTKAIDEISINPHFNVHIKKLKGELSSKSRYRLGEIRILFEIHEELKIVRIAAIEARGSVYK